MGVLVRQNAKGWWLRITHRGQRLSKFMGKGDKGKAAAKLAAPQIAARLALGGSISKDSTKVPSVATFKDAATAWTEWYTTHRDPRPGTMRVRQSFLDTHLLPYFGQTPVDQITLEAIDTFTATKRAVGGGGRLGKGLADASLKKCLDGLRLVLKFCIRRKWLTVNPMQDDTWQPVRQAAVPDPFTGPEVKAIVQAATEVDPRLGLMVRAWAQSGLRSGELRGLRWSDYDVTSGVVQIQRTRTNRENGPPKTDHSRRRVVLTHPTVEATTAWHPGTTTEAASVVAALAKRVPVDLDAPLFPSLANPAKPMDEQELRRHWRHVLAKSKVRPRVPETLRHTWASTMLSRNAPVLYVQAQGGWVSAAVLLRVYSRWLPQ